MLNLFKKKPLTNVEMLYQKYSGEIRYIEKALYQLLKDKKYTPTLKEIKILGDLEESSYANYASFSHIANKLRARVEVE